MTRDHGGATPGDTATSATATTTVTTTTPLTGLRRAAFLGYRWALLVFLLAGVAQIFLAGLGVFSVEDHGVAGDTAFAPHRTLGFTIAGLALIILVLALIARPGARAITGAVVLVILTSLMQSLLAGLADSQAVFGALHALDGLLILGVAGYLYARSRRHWT
jgi:Family of unknown function (DUF6220)